MPVELIWLAGVVAVGSGILIAALYSEASEHYRRRTVNVPVRRR